MQDYGIRAVSYLNPIKAVLDLTHTKNGFSTVFYGMKLLNDQLSPCRHRPVQVGSVLAY